MLLLPYQCPLRWSLLVVLWLTQYICLMTTTQAFLLPHATTTTTTTKSPAATITETKNAREILSKKAITTATTKRTTTTVLYNTFLSAITGIPSSKPFFVENPSLGKKLFMNTYLANKWDSGTISCVYKASRDGWSATDFHQCVDGKGSGLVVALARTSPSVLFGGYNPSGWRSTDDYLNSNAAFLWYSRGGANQPIKCPIYPGGNAAVYDFATSGPCFGSSDLVIGAPKAAIMGGFAGPDMENTSLNAGSLKSCQSNFGGTYNKDTNWPIRGNNIPLVEVEVYCVE